MSKSKRVSNTTIDGVEYGFKLLGVFEGQEIAGKIGALLLGANTGKIDPKVLPEISKQVLKGLYADGLEVNDLEEHFDGEFVLMNRVVFEGIKLNFPDLVAKMTGLAGSDLVTNLLNKSKLATGLSD